MNSIGCLAHFKSLHRRVLKYLSPSYPSLPRCWYKISLSKGEVVSIISHFSEFVGFLPHVSTTSSSPGLALWILWAEVTVNFPSQVSMASWVTSEGTLVHRLPSCLAFYHVNKIYSSVVTSVVHYGTLQQDEPIDKPGIGWVYYSKPYTNTSNWRIRDSKHCYKLNHAKHPNLQQEENRHGQLWQ